MISGDQLICCFDSCFPAFLASDQLISCHAGRRIQKSHIVMIYFDLIVNTVQKALHLHLTCFFQAFVLWIFISQPDLSGPEPTGPVIVRNRLIETVLAVGILELIGKFRQIPDHLLRGKPQCFFDLFFCYLRIFFLVKRNHFLLSSWSFIVLTFIFSNYSELHLQNRIFDACFLLWTVTIFI